MAIFLQRISANFARLLRLRSFTFLRLSALTLSGPRGGGGGRADTAHPAPRTAIHAGCLGRAGPAPQGRGQGRGGAKGVWAGLMPGAARGEVRTGRGRGCAPDRGGGVASALVGGAWAGPRRQGPRPGLRSAPALSARDACECVVRAAGSWRGRWTLLPESLVLPVVLGRLAEVSVRALRGRFPGARVSAGFTPACPSFPLHLRGLGRRPVRCPPAAALGPGLGPR